MDFLKIAFKMVQFRVRTISDSYGLDHWKIGPLEIQTKQFLTKWRPLVWILNGWALLIFNKLGTVRIQNLRSY